MKLHENSTSTPQSTGIPIYMRNNSFNLEIEHISYLQGEGNYTHIYTTSGKRYLVSKTLKNLETCLNHSFIRIHKSYLINSRYIDCILNHDRIIKMLDGKEVIISRRKSKEVTERLNDMRA